MKIRLSVFLLIFSLSALAAGDAQLLSNMELYNTIYRGQDDWFFMPSGKAAISVRSPRDPNVQGHTEIEFFPMDLYGSPIESIPALNVKRAYVKTRFPGFRMTLGKTRLVWGQGSVFNAGDVLFGSLNPVLDLTESELRSDTAWLTAFNVPLGNFSFVEAVVLPPAMTLTGDNTNPIEISGIGNTSIGGRGYFTLSGVKVEGGYLYKGEKKVAADAVGHRPYISLQGNIGPDWYLSSSIAIPTDQQIQAGAPTDWKKSWNLSFGLFHMQEINRNNTLNLRLETLWLPYQNWSDQGSRDSIYGFYLYPEISWTTSTSTFYSFQSVISPLDASAMITGGAGWNIYQGLMLIAYATFMVGDDASTFAWDRSGNWAPTDNVNGISVMTGLRYKF